MVKKDSIIAGMILGISLFFIGAIIYNVFPSSETNLTPYKVSASIKLIGLGFLVASMIVGGIDADIDKNARILLLIMGLILLIIYSLASPSLEWKVTSYSESPYETKPTGYGIPGFEVPLALASILSIALLARMRLKWRKRN